MRWAYERRLETRRHSGPEHAAPPQSGAPEGGLITQGWQYSRRASGNARVSGVAQMYAPDPGLALDGKPGEVNPDSKGCGAVMRSAPFGLLNSADQAFERLAEGWVAEQAVGVHCALVTPAVPDALLPAVNHSGDSDSTGSLCADDLAAESVRR